MGNADLRTLASIIELDDDDLNGTTVAVDASNWLYKYLYNVVKFSDRAVYTTPDGEQLPNLVATVMGLNKFFEQNITPLFVFDGRPHELKADELASRRKARAKADEKRSAAEKEGDSVAASNYEARSIRLTTDITDTTKELLDILDVPYITAPGAAEAQAARLCADGLVQYVISDDYDALLFGSPRTVRNFTSASKPLELLDFEATLTTHDLTWKQLVEVGMLCGTDYNTGVKGIGPKTGVKLVAKHGNIEEVLSLKDASIENVKAVRDIFLTVGETTTGDVAFEQKIDPALDDAYEYITETWGLNSEKLDTAFESLRTHFEQPGLDRWSS